MILILLSIFCIADEYLAIPEWENVEQQHISWEYVEEQELEVIVDPYGNVTEDQNYQIPDYEWYE
jgi:hypothetical protein